VTRVSRASRVTPVLRELPEPTESTVPRALRVILAAAARLVCQDLTEMSVPREHLVMLDPTEPTEPRETPEMLVPQVPLLPTVSTVSTAPRVLLVLQDPTVLRETRVCRAPRA